jgi:hypothetical protein
MERFSLSTWEMFSDSGSIQRWLSDTCSMLASIPVIISGRSSRSGSRFGPMPITSPPKAAAFITVLPATLLESR